MFLPLFIAFLVQGLLLGLVVLALLAAAPKLQKRYGPRWLCRLWVALAVLFLVPVRALLPQAPAAVTVSAQPFYTQMTALTEETTTKPAANVPYRTTTADDNTMHYIVPRAELQTGRRTVLERLAIDTNWGNLAALAWELGVMAVALYQFGGYAVWRIRVGRNAQPVAKSWRDALPQGQCPQMQATPLVRSPMVAGALHPVLLVPAGEALKGAECMLAHELTHIKRHDVAKKLLLTLVCILHWYNPAVWMLAARAGRDIEEACDAETLRFPAGQHLIVSCSAVQWFERPERFLSGCRELLTTGGYLAFSTFGPQNVREVASLTSETLPYRSLEELRRTLSGVYQIVYSREEILHFTFPLPLDVLKHLQATGVTGLRSRKWTKGQLEDFCQRYHRQYAAQDGTVPLTYHPIYMICKKQEK